MCVYDSNSILKSNEEQKQQGEDTCFHIIDNIFKSPWNQTRVLDAKIPALITRLYKLEKKHMSLQQFKEEEVKTHTYIKTE